MFGALVRLQGFVRKSVPVGVAVLATAVLAACGSGRPAPRLSPTERAQSLLRQTFGSAHRIESGRLGFTLTLTPSGSASSAVPMSISLAGPFQSRGANRLPASDFNVSVSARNRTSSLSVISTGDAGYITAGGKSYRLPASSFQKLESSLSSVASTGSAGGHSAGGSTAVTDLSKLGIHPEDWLTDPRVVGTDSVAGVATTRIHAQVDVSKLVLDMSTLLSKASTLGLSNSVAKLPDRLSGASQRQLAAEIRDPSVDVWTGAADRILRKLSVSLQIPGLGQLVGQAGGGSLALALTLQYSELNQPQTITAPANAEPFSAYSAQLEGLAQQLRTATPTRVPHSRSAANPTELTLSPYAQCISNAAGNVTKMQACASLSNGTAKTDKGKKTGKGR